LALAAGALLMLGAAAPAGAPHAPAPAAWQVADDDAAPSGDDPLRLPAVLSMVERGHRFLVAQQEADGSFSIVRNQASMSAPVAVTALTALSFMAAGHVPDPERGLYGRSAARAVNWLVDRCGADGYFRSDRDEISRMHGQGYALLALTQAYGMYTSDKARHERLRDAIQRGVELIERAQGELGGWYYEPRAMDMHEGSITVCMVQALRAARDAGFAVDGGVIERAQIYLWRSQNPVSGKFKYALQDQRETWALTAAALATLNALGDYGSERVELGFDALQRDDPFLGSGNFEAFLQYGALYAAQAYWQHRDPRTFHRWWDGFLAQCLDQQRADGSFRNGEYGAVFATAITTLTLQVPLGYLPLFQK
jgi:hypothetical protein